MEQYGRRNNIEITGIPESVENEKLEETVVEVLNKINLNVSNNNIENEKLEETVVEVLNKINLNVSNNNIEACQRLGKQKNKPRKTIIRFVNRKFAKKALLNRKGLKHAVASALLFEFT